MSDEGIRLRIDVDDGHVTREGVRHFTAGAGRVNPTLTYADGATETIEGGRVRYGELEGSA